MNIADPRMLVPWGLIQPVQIQGRLPNWLRAPTPQDSNVAATGLFMDQIHRARRLAFEQAQANADYAAARDLAGLQMATHIAQIEARKQKRAEQIEQQRRYMDFVETLPEEQRPAARANPAAFVDEFAKAQYRQERASTPQRIFQEMGGQEGTGMTFPEWYSTAYKTGTTTNVNVRPAEMKEPIRQRLLQYGAIEQNIDRLDELLKEHGTEVIPSDSKSRMRTVYKALTIDAKNLFQLGALSGSDYDLITETLSDPTAPQAAAVPASRYRVQLDEIRRILSGARTRLAATLPEGERAGVVGTGTGSADGQWNETGSGARWRVRQ